MNKTKIIINRKGSITLINKGIEISIYSKDSLHKDNSMPEINWSFYGPSSIKFTKEFMSTMHWAIDLAENIKRDGWEEALIFEEKTARSEAMTTTKDQKDELAKKLKESMDLLQQILDSGVTATLKDIAEDMIFENRTK